MKNWNGTWKDYENVYIKWGGHTWRSHNVYVFSLCNDKHIINAVRMSVFPVNPQVMNDIKLSNKSSVEERTGLHLICLKKKTKKKKQAYTWKTKKNLVKTFLKTKEKNNKK